MRAAISANVTCLGCPTGSTPLRGCYAIATFSPQRTELSYLALPLANSSDVRIKVHPLTTTADRICPVTNARFTSLHGLPVALLPCCPSTTPVPLRKSARSSRAAIALAAAAAGFRLRLGGGRCAPAAFHYALLSASAPLSPLADRRPKPDQNPLGIEVQIFLSLSQKLGSFCDS